MKGHIQEFVMWFKDLVNFMKTWSKTAWFLIITSILYVVFWVYLEFYVGYRDAIELAQMAYVFVLSVGLVVVHIFKQGRKN